MSHQLTFAQLMNYDPGQPGITIDTSLSLNSDRVTCEAKIDTGQRNVLGRRGFMEQVRLGLIDYEGKLYLSSYDE